MDEPASYLGVPVVLVQKARRLITHEVTALNVELERVHRIGRGVGRDDAERLRDEPDREKRGARQDLLRISEFDAYASVANALDHARALVSTLVEPIPTWAPVTLVRVVQNAALRYCYLLDPSSDLETRLLRAGAMHLDNRLHEARAARLLRGADAEESQRAAEDAVALVEHAGMTVVRGRRDRVEALTSERGGRCNLAMDVAAAAEKWTPDLPAVWQLGSATVHSALWYVGGDIVVDEHGGFQAQTNPELPLLVLMVVCFSFQAIADTAGRYHGRGDGDYRVRSQRRIHAMTLVREEWRRSLGGGGRLA